MFRRNKFPPDEDFFYLSKAQCQKLLKDPEQDNLPHEQITKALDGWPDE